MAATKETQLVVGVEEAVIAPDGLLASAGDHDRRAARRAEVRWGSVDVALGWGGVAGLSVEGIGN